MLTAWQESLLSALGGLAAVLYLVVGYVQGKRRISPEANLARTGFVLWWVGLGLLGVYGILTSTVLDTESFSLAEYRVVLYTLIPIIFTALAGLVYYLLYLYTGKRNLFVVVSVFYAVLTVAFVLFVELQDPFIGQDPDTGEVGLQYASEAPAWVGLLFSISLVFPPFAAAVAYSLLFFRAHDRTVKYRIALVSSGFVLWMGFSLLGSLSRYASGVEERGFGGQLVSQLLGILSAMLVLLAYYPPRVLQRALRLESLGNPHMDQDSPVDFKLADRPKERMQPTAGLGNA